MRALTRVRRAAQWMAGSAQDVVRLTRAGWRAGLLSNVGRRPIETAAAALSHGLGVRSVHALHAASDPDRLAVADARRRLTYAEANAEIEAVAAGLRDRLGASRRQPVLVMLDNRVEYIVVWFALFRLGITCAHLSCFGTADEIEPLVERSGGQVIVVSGRTASVVHGVAARRPDLGLRIVDVDGGADAIAYADLVEAGRGHPGAVAPGPTSDNVVYTSGTTGRPKGAVRNFAALGVVELLSILDRLPLRVGDRHLVVAPLYHSGAQAFVLLNTALGATVVLQDKFEPRQTLAELAHWGIHSVFMVPTMIRRVLEAAEQGAEPVALPELRVLISGAAVFDDALRLRAIERFGADAVFDFYGATELGWVTLADGREMLARPGTLGRAIPGQEVAIMDEQGRRCGPGEVGRIYARSAQVMSGYLADEEATDRIRRGPWLTVDDLGRLDDGGYLFLTGRDRDMVITGGVNVYPVEVENVLASHPDVREVAVIGVPDAQWGECLTAVYVGPKTLDPDHIKRWASACLSPYKIPRRYVKVDALPRNPTGKVLKRTLIEQIG